ncbi:hypothetical protein M408DRAFT_333351 [Serendipita vermifera MAFF 305830]|uniref:Response regulatory domain-containing protein n=1 Tax=Serendipita vermifera MAFF 305830 TaxID=933852 RepID=A0A0C3AQT6_SERVB|nr:hypothetical protein M408DRAFT_333351 [Serendipita vermifera MAFF 305830]
MAQSALGITNTGDSTLQPAATLRTFLQPTPLDPGWSSDASVDNEQPEQTFLDRDDAHNVPVSLPRLSRAFSMPLPSQLGHLRRPHRTSHLSQQNITSSSSSNVTSDEVSIELADSVQMAIQTLLQISPPHLLDPAKEQLAGCALQVPTPSISALFTSMKMLNYLARTISPSSPISPDGSPSLTLEDEFDVGELLQSVGDVLSGVAAEAGVDLVIFHTDPSLKNLTIRADECGLAYALSHVSRQMLATASKGDVLEVGLRLSPGTLASSDSQGKVGPDGTMSLTFEFLHRAPGIVSEHGESPAERIIPANLQNATLRNLLKALRADLRVDLVPRGAYLYRKYDLVVTVKPGKQILAAHTLPKEEEAIRQPFPDLRLAREPSIGELLEFASTLKGQKATFYASTKSSFAHYLTIYLTGWGMDVTHMPPDGGLSTSPSTENLALPDSIHATAPEEAVTKDEDKPASESVPSNILAPFTIIDDNINVLRAKLSEFQIPLFQALQESRPKRPSLAAHHRPKSSSLIRRTMTSISETSKPSFSSVIVYFTSLSRYREVKDVVQAIMMPKIGRRPEIIVIPKPAGVRRFLTALYTAVTKPMVDPVFFSPIATSPMSPNGLTVPPFFTPAVQSPRPTASPLPPSDPMPELATTPFSSGTPTPIQTIPASPVGTGGYFERESKKMAGSASSGLFVKSPDGRTGIFFQPLAPPTDPADVHTENSTTPKKHAEAESLQPTPIQSAISAPPRQAPTTINQPINLHPSTFSKIHPVPTLSVHVSPPATSPVPLADTTTMISDPVFDPGPVIVKATKPAKTSIVGAKVKKQTDVVVPPISVLIVEDNSIQRTILSTFMKNKHIAYGIAENGQEAVERWSTGNYHLVLMDIQMPVMDGIEATKRIRELEGQRHRALSVLTPLSEGAHTPTSTTSNESQQPSTPFHSSVIIVALTAQSSPQDRVAALAAGCNDFLSKPVKLQWLERKIIEWGSIKALQMWADPEVEPSLRKRQQASAQIIANNLRIVRPANKTNNTPNGAGLHNP